MNIQTFKTEAEAYDICKAEIEQFGKPGARTNPKYTYIWFLLDTGDRYSSVIYRYCESSEFPFEQVDRYDSFCEEIHNFLSTHSLEDEEDDGKEEGKFYFYDDFDDDGNDQSNDIDRYLGEETPSRFPRYKKWCNYFDYGVERRNPHKLSELTRATILDNCHCNLRPCLSGLFGAPCNCCRRILSENIFITLEKIQLLEISVTEKMEIKKLTNLL
jgi:hypothetical protein